MKAENKNEAASRRSKAGGPPSATQNEMEQARAGNDDDKGRNPTVSKQDAGRTDSTEGETH